MGNIRTVSITHTRSIDPSIKRGVSYTGILDLNELKEKLQGNYSIAIAAEFPVYKWFPDPHQVNCYAHYYEPTDDIPARKAATLDKSLGNLLVSHLPGWAALPERETAAMVYSGRMYRAVPELNSKLVIAPAAHLRYSFPYALRAFGVPDGKYGSLAKITSCLHGLFHACGIEDEVLSNWPLFLAILNDIAFEKIRPEGKVSSDSEIVLAALVKNKAHLLVFLDNAFSPLHNGFKVVDYNEGLKKEDYPDNEIWMASPCLLIEEELFERI